MLLLCGGVIGVHSDWRFRSGQVSPFFLFSFFAEALHSSLTISLSRLAEQTVYFFPRDLSCSFVASL